MCLNTKRNCVFDKILRLMKSYAKLICIQKSREDKFLRRKKARFMAVDNSHKNAKSKKQKSFLKNSILKVTSLLVAVLVVGAAVVIPTSTLTPDVEALANKKALALSVGNLDDFSTAIKESCVPVHKAYVEETTEPETTEEATTEAVTETETVATTEATTEQTTTQETTEALTEAVEEKTVSTVSSSVSKGDYLLSISNPDPNYSTKTVSLTSSDRDLLERLVMGEAGSLGFEGCALIAQAIKDTMILEGTTSVQQVINDYNYSGSVKSSANSAAKQAVSYVFDQNGSAVQHRILYFYEKTICESQWHESQNFIIEYHNVRFFDRW